MKGVIDTIEVGHSRSGDHVVGFFGARVVADGSDGPRVETDMPSGEFALFVALDEWSKTAEGTLLSNGMRVIDVVEGVGPQPKVGDKVFCHFKVWS